MNPAQLAPVSAQGGGFPPGGGGYGPPGGGGYGPPGGGPFGPPGGGPPGGYGPPGGAPPGGYGPPGAPPGGYGPPGGGPFGPPGGGGYGPPGYGPPGGGFAPPPGNMPPPGGGGAFSSPGLEAMDAIAFAWNVITKDLPGVALPLALGFFVMILPLAVVAGGTGFALGFLTGTGTLDAQTSLIINLGSRPIIAVIWAASQAFMLGGMTTFALRVARGEKPELGVVFSGGPTFVPMFGAVLCYNFGVSIGMVFCIVPGVILAVGAPLFQQLVVDKRMGPIDALTESFRLTAGHRFTLFVYFLLMFLVSLAGTLACCLGAILIAAPMHALGSAYIYMKLTGEQPRPA